MHIKNYLRNVALWQERNSERMHEYHEMTHSGVFVKSVSIAAETASKS
jgi:hypothetical protein